MTRRQQLLVGGVVAAVALAALFQSVFIVGQSQEAVVLHLGRPARVIHASGQGGAGLNVKTPFLEQVVKFDRRNLGLAADQQTVTAADQQQLMIDAFLRYRITDPLQFYRTFGDERTAAGRLAPLVGSALRQVLGQASSADIISGRRAELTARTKALVARQAKAGGFGIQVIDVRIKRVDLPPADQAAVFRRMQTADEQQASQIRASGEQQKGKTIAAADKEVAAVLAAAHQKADAIQGQGEAERARIFARSYGRDPAFASFYRSMQAYEKALANGDTTVVLSPGSGFLRYFGHGPGVGR